MTGEQLDLFDGFPAASVDANTQAVLELIDGDPIHARDRAVIVEAILEDARTHGGRIDPNRVRPALSNVYPRCIGSTYRALCTLGVIRVDGWAVNGDHSGRNAGRPMRLYRRIA